MTKVFPDEYHLHTLDILLPAMARLNPNVDLKKIVIVLMDRLSSYALRDSDSNADPRVKQKSEEEAVARLLNKLKVADGSEQPSEPTSRSDDENPKKSSDEAASEEGKKREDDKEASGSSSADIDSSKDEKESSAILPNSIKLYEIFYEQVVNLVRARGLSIQDTVALLVSLANLSLSIYPDRIENIDQILGYAAARTKLHSNSSDLHAAAFQPVILNLLLAPIRSYQSIFTALALPNYAPLFSAQTYTTRRAVAGEIARGILRKGTVISTRENLERVMQILGVLIKEGQQQPVGYAGIQSPRRGETDETIEEQGWLARIVHYIQGPDNDTQLELLRTAYKAYLQGNERIRYVIPAIITQTLKLARSYKKREHFDDNWQSQSAALYRFMHTCISSLYQRVNPGCAELALRLFVLCGQTADQTGFEQYSYEFFAQAFTIYEDSISDSRAQFQAVCVIAGALQGTRGFSKENYDTLITKAALHGSKLLKKPDQCRAVYLASHLWWAVENPARGEEDAKNLYRDGKRVLECLQRALRVADACMDPGVSIELFIEILNRYVYYFDQQNETVTTKYLNGLIELIHSNLQTSENEGISTTSLDNPRQHFQRTLDYIRSREYDGVVTDPRI
ncbi:Vacuolar protein sorting-associated protein 35 [Ascosphaera aggregata]|nr:Vacuolar protein sorting-associated protein 35 [Ascosphaera aggregata]